MMIKDTVVYRRTKRTWIPGSKADLQQLLWVALQESYVQPRPGKVQMVSKSHVSPE